MTACTDSSEVPPADKAGGTPTRSTTGSHEGRVMVNVQAQGAYDDGAFHYLRIEDHTGRVVLERQYRRDSDVRLATRLHSGRYRVISWQRPCEGAYPGKGHGHARLGAPTDICGTKIKVVANQLLTVSVRLKPRLGCTAVSR